MVYGVCRRAVRDAHLAEDALQAVFLVLANHPNRALNASAVGGWLFGVARRVGLAARRRADRQSRRSAIPRREVHRDQPDFDELLRVLDEELAALPDGLRAPMVACFLEERTLDEAARQLGWSVSTLRRRLDRAKELLRARLTRRGATLAAGLFAGFLSRSSSAAVPARLLEAASPGGVPSASARALASEFARGSAMFPVAVASLVVALGLGGLAMGLDSVDAASQEAPSTPKPLSPRAASDAMPPQPAEVRWTALRGRVIWPADRAIPGVRAVAPESIKDFAFFGPQRVRDTLIDPGTRGIANVVVWLRPDSNQAADTIPSPAIPPELAAARPVQRSIRASAEGFTPRVLAVRAGDTLSFSNPTPVPFTVHYQRAGRPGRPISAASTEFNVLLPPGRTHVTRPLPPLAMCDTVTDTIHPWVEARVWAFDHPHFAVTDEWGEFVIPDAPVGTWRLVVWHERSGFGACGRLGERITIAPEGGMLTLALEVEP
jgi:RNA polymerase sigma factor (sigma-70 family)